MTDKESCGSLAGLTHTPPDSPCRAHSIALIAVDLDGTLLRHDSTPAPEGAHALAKAVRRGVHVVLSTTRNLSAVRRLAAEIGLAEPVICSNGALILGSPAGPVWRHRLIPRALAEALVTLADAQGYRLITTVGDVSYYRQQEGQPLGEMHPGRRVVACNAEALEAGDPIRILNYDPDGRPHLREICTSQFPDQAHVETYLRSDGSEKSVGIFAAGSDKGSALRLVCERLGVDSRRVMAIGDNPNDLPMFAAAGVRVAMENATEAVKAAATAVAPSNDDEGVAWAVYQFVLGKGGGNV